MSPVWIRRAALVVLLVAAAVVLSAALSACGSNASTPDGESWGSYYVEKVRVDDRMVTCVVWSGVEKGGVDCDWDGAR